MTTTCQRIRFEMEALRCRRKDSEPVDALCLVQACNGVALDLKHSCQQWASLYNVPGEVVFRMVADRFIFDLTGVTPLSTDYFAELATEIVREEIAAAKEEQDDAVQSTTIPNLAGLKNLDVSDAR